MSEVKWIKIVTDIFDDEKILLIESMPDSDALIVIWFKLLCLAGKQNNNGVFLLSGRIYTDEMFATIFRRPLNTVRLALKTFENLGMIEIVNNTVTIPNWGKHQQLDALEASREATRKRVERYREKQKCLADGSEERGNVTGNVTDAVTVTFGNADRIDKNRVDKKRGEKNREENIESPMYGTPLHCNGPVTTCNTEKEIEKEIEKEKEKEGDKRKNDDVRRVCEMLNSKAGTNYRPGTAATQKHINARLAEGFTVDDFQTVIDKKCAEWLGTDMEKYLRPETLFGSKFESYLNAPATRAKKSSNPFEDMIREQEERMRAVEVEAEVIP